MDTQRRIGTVQWFNENKGFGFISTEDEEDDIFVHFTQIETDSRYKTLAADQLVEFSQALTTKGLQALDVVPLVSKVVEKEIDYAGVGTDTNDPDPAVSAAGGYETG